MPAAVINRIETGHPDEQADCVMVSLATYLAISYTDVIRLATVLDSQHGKRGLWPGTAIRIAADFGHTLKRRKLTEDSYGIVFTPTHAGVVREGLVIDRNTIWPVDVWLKTLRCPPSRAGAIGSTASSGSSRSSNTRSADATADWRTFAMDAVWMIGKVNWREYWMNAMTSPRLICPVATWTPPMTAMAT